MVVEGPRRLDDTLERRLYFVMNGGGQMKVLVFDIDGTLTGTNEIDWRCFRDAVGGVLPGVEVGEFEGFPDVTDTGILRDICARTTDRPYADVESEVIDRFLSGLRTSAETEPEAFLPIRGAQSIFQKVRAAGWAPAIATGGWRPSARLKLDQAGIPIDGVPLSTCSEARRRVDIIRGAVAQVSVDESPTAVVYVGDGVWDVRACRELSIGFVGRAALDDADRLVAAGARATIPHFLDPNALIELLTEPAALEPE